MIANEQLSTKTAISTNLQVLPTASQLPILLHLIKVVTRLIASDTLCSYQDSCRYGEKCWFKHLETTMKPPIHLETHDPYAPPPSFSQRQGQKEGRRTRNVSTQSSRSTSPGIASTSRAQGQTSESEVFTSSFSNFNQFNILRAERGDDSEASINSGSWTTVKHRKRPQRKEDPPDMARCKDCNELYDLTENCRAWFTARGLHVPLRCKQCRQFRKLKTEEPADEPRRPCPPAHFRTTTKQWHRVSPTMSVLNDQEYPRLQSQPRSAGANARHPAPRAQRSSSTCDYSDSSIEGETKLLLHSQPQPARDHGESPEDGDADSTLNDADPSDADQSRYAQGPATPNVEASAQHPAPSAQRSSSTCDYGDSSIDGEAKSFLSDADPSDADQSRNAQGQTPSAQRPPPTRDGGQALNDHSAKRAIRQTSAKPTLPLPSLTTRTTMGKSNKKDASNTDEPNLEQLPTISDFDIKNPKILDKLQEVLTHEDTLSVVKAWCSVRKSNKYIQSEAGQYPAEMAKAFTCTFWRHHSL